MNDGGAGTGLFFLLFVAVFYFLPAVIAGSRGHANAGAIFVLNLLLGWTFVGWVVALVWSFTYQGEPDRSAAPAPRQPEAASEPQRVQALQPGSTSVGARHFILAAIIFIGVLGGISLTIKSGGGADGCADPEACREANRKAYAQIGKKRWVYFDGRDKMTGAAHRTASIESPETLDFQFPYNGGSTARLTVQKRGGDTSIWFAVDKGQILCSIVGDDYIRVKFDGGKVQNFRCLVPADGSSSMIAFGEAAQFIKALKSSEKLLIEVTFYQEGARQVGFDVAGLEWK